MEDFLTTNYQIQYNEEISIDNKRGFINDGILYFIISSGNKEMIHMEQAALAYFLVEKGYNQTAFPVPNIYGNWISEFEEQSYLVVQVRELQEKPAFTHGIMLANFHQMSTTYGYEPQQISSYGQWKQLWINKLTVFENEIIEKSKSNSHPFYQQLMDVLPYLTGISENAIQYMQESEQESRYHEADQGTVSFYRYKDNVLKQVLWVDDLVYDHPTRDLAEFVRTKLMQSDEENSVEELKTFMKDYESIRPLSVFSWRLLYARLIFPVHIFDLIERALLTEDYDLHHEELNDIFEKQSIYEQRLGHLFQTLSVNYEKFQIPVLKWL